MIVTLFIVFCSTATQCDTYKPATWESDDYSALAECEKIAAGLPEQMLPRCRAAFKRD